MAAIPLRTRGKHRARRGVATARPPAGLPSRNAPQLSATTVVVRPQVLRMIAQSAMASTRRETGGPLVGTVQRTWRGTEAGLLVSVLATVPALAAHRSGESWVNLGRTGDGERAASALRWWRAVTGLDLRHVGDWHKHYSGMPEPSEGDRRTAAGMAVKSSVPVWLVAVTVGDRRDTEDLESGGHVARLTWASAASNEVRFYRQVRGVGLLPVAVRAEGEAIPGLPPVPWHVADPARFAVECRLLRTAGWSIAIDPIRPDGKLGLALRLARNGDRPVRILTGLRHPAEPPSTLDDCGRVRLRSSWGPGRFLVDLAEEVNR